MIEYNFAASYNKQVLKDLQLENIIILCIFYCDSNC